MNDIPKPILFAFFLCLSATALGLAALLVPHLAAGAIARAVGRKP